MEKKVKLSVLGFSFNQTQSGTYGLVLAEDAGLRRLMIIIGTPEAQSIAFVLHETQPPRPLTHDLFVSMITGFNIHLQEILIYKYDNGVFFSRLILTGADGRTVIIESRTSDAIGIALRTNSPVYTTENIMQELAIVVSDLRETADNESSESSAGQEEKCDYSTFSKTELEAMLMDAINGEDYELASVLRDEIKQK
ncbi:bifunctional nuclease family protein [Viscerimonas tarda]